MAMSQASKHEYPRSYFDAQTKLGNREKRNLPGRATTLGIETRYNDRTDQYAYVYVVRYHSTAIVTFWADGRIEINNGGWATPTTKEKINTCLRGVGAYIYQRSFKWYLVSHPTPCETRADFVSQRATLAA